MREKKEKVGLLTAKGKSRYDNNTTRKKGAEPMTAGNYVSSQNPKNEDCVEELKIANTRLDFQNEDIEKRETVLGAANKELDCQNRDKEKQGAELLIVNYELAFQNAEKEKRAAELLIANKELAFQNKEKETRAAELLIANDELAFQNAEKEKRAVELIIANEELAFQNKEKEKRAAELSAAVKKLEKTEKHLQEYIRGMEKIMFMTSHKVRRPIANILDISNILDEYLSDTVKLKELVEFIKESALSLEAFTKELTDFIIKLENKKSGKSAGV